VTSRVIPRTESVTVDGFVTVRGAREHNLKDVDVDIPRDALVVFSGVSGSGKSSLAFGTIYAEAQRRYFESVSPYARRLIDQVGVPDVDSIEGLPPAVALQQQRGSGGARSTVGSITTIANSLRMLYSRAGSYPRGHVMLHAEDFSPNTPQGACPACHGLGHVYDATEASMVPDASLTIRERAIAAWPTAWHGQNLRDILVTLGYDVDTPWRDLPQKDRRWILFTDEQPTVPVYAGLTPRQARAALRAREEPSYMGTFTGARRYVLHTFATTQSELMKRRVARYLVGGVCQACGGKRLKPQALAVTFAGLDIGSLSQLTLDQLALSLKPAALGTAEGLRDEMRIVAQRIAQDLLARITSLQELGLGYLSLDRTAPSLSPGELQRLRVSTQIRSKLFGVIYVLDEPSAGLHPADGEALLSSLQSLKAASNSLFIVEHDVDIMRQADWLVDVGPGAGDQGGRILYSGPPKGLSASAESVTGRYLTDQIPLAPHRTRSLETWLELREVSRHNLRGLDARFPLHAMTAVTGVSGSGKSTLVSQVLVELVGNELGGEIAADHSDTDSADGTIGPDLHAPTIGHIAGGQKGIRRLVRVDQKPIGRTPRSNVATYTGLFDAVRRLFAATPAARARHFDASRFSFNVAKGRCPRCEGEGFVCVELLFLPSVYAPCPTCHGSRYNEATLAVRWHDHTIAEILALAVAEACVVFADEPSVLRPLALLRDIGLGYLRLGQPATELSGGEAQRVKLATELQRIATGNGLYVLDEPSTGLHPADVDRLLVQLQRLVDAGNTVILVEHEMRMVASCDWVIDMGPGAGSAGGKIVATGTPRSLADLKPSVSRTAPYLRRQLA
jgi:excinuclease ABC subunit A